MLKRYLRILTACWQTFGLSKDFVAWLLIIPLFGLFTRITLALDILFFPDYRQTKIQRPIFIIGHPRSGTTFLHNLLTQTDEFVTFDTWHMFFPALSARKLIKPLIDNAIKKGKATLLPAEIGHKVALDQPEEEEFIFIHTLDTLLLNVMTPLAFRDQGEGAQYCHDQHPESRRRHSIRFFKQCLQRQVYYTGKQRVIAKPNYSVYRLKTLMAAFPDAKFIYLVRSPHKTLPSYFSLHRNMFDHQWGLNNLSDDLLKKYFAQKYHQSLNLYHYFYELQQNQEIPPEQVMILKSDFLYAQPQQAFEQIAAFTDLNPNVRLKQAVAQQAQEPYQSRHAVLSLQAFGLTPEQINRDFSFVFDTYGLERPNVDLTVSSHLKS